MEFKNKIINGISNLIIFFIFLLTPLYLFSFITTLRVVKNEANIIEKQRRINEDVILKQNAIDQNFLPTYYPASVKEYFKGTEFYPVGSLPYQDTYYCNEGYGLIKYKTDRLGMRNRDDSWSNVLEKENIF